MNKLRDQLQALAVAAFNQHTTEQKAAIAASYGAHAVTVRYIEMWLRKPAHIQRSIRLVTAMGGRVVFYGHPQSQCVSIEW